MFLTVSELGVRYPGRDQPAVQGVSLNLAAGDIGVLIGPSGCGKTTLLRAVAGLEPVSSGEIRIDGQLVGSAGYALPPEQRRIGMVFQDYALFPHLSVGRNVSFGIHHLPKARQQQRVDEVLELVGLAGSAQRYPHELSGGQQQRVALARALAPSPQLMLLDEPFSNLDVDLRERLAHEVRGILKAAGATALFVTHDQLEAFAIGDMIGVVHQGRLQQWDDAHSLYHRPTTRFVADFIGHGVFVPARLALDGHGAVVARTALGEFTEKHSCPLPSQFPGGECDLLLRADDVVHDDASPVQARITRKSFRGSEFLYTLQLASGHSVLAHVPSHHDHAVGESVGIRLDMDHVVAFPREAGQPAS
ncbi:ABC transporter ATP-binding protein [Comamonas composti]|uniref:ABC transporter ATP-binding protein n=1 Tax=Comamonas composti TaxID=408558 RepID=UPI000408D75D|nr:ABC transporter ATP-binding protein [Comamonas composti]